MSLPSADLLSADGPNFAACRKRADYPASPLGLVSVTSILKSTPLRAQEACAALARIRGWKFGHRQPGNRHAHARFGVHVERDPGVERITPTCGPLSSSRRTIVKVHSGTDWTPAQLVADLKAAPAPAN